MPNHGAQSEALSRSPKTRTDARWPLPGAALVALAAALWSSGGLFIKLAPVPAPALAFGRSALAALVLLVALRPRLARARWDTALSCAGTTLSFVLATRLTTAANAVFLQYTGPAYVLVLGPWLLGERFRRVDALCVAASLGGMTLALLGGRGAGHGGHLAGDALAAACGVFFAFNVVLLRRDAARGGGAEAALASTTLGNLLAALIALPLAWPSLPALFAPRALAVLLYLGLVQTGLAYVLFARGVARTSAATASLVCMLEPVLNPVWVLLGTGERPGAWALAGGAVVLTAVALRTLAVAREAPAPVLAGAPAQTTPKALSSAVQTSLQ
jgi:drug/metabolite transporter (DMT)-like permease